MQGGSAINAAGAAEGSGRVQHWTTEIARYQSTNYREYQKENKTEGRNRGTSVERWSAFLLWIFGAALPTLNNPRQGSWHSRMAPKRERDTSRTIIPSIFSGPPVGTKYQIVGGLGVKTYEEVRKQLNDMPDFIPERGYRCKDLRGYELIPGLPNDIVAERVWPRIREGTYDESVKQMLNMRHVSQFWCAFMDHSDLMDQVMREKYTKIGPRRFKYAPSRLFVFARLLEGTLL